MIAKRGVSIPIHPNLKKRNRLYYKKLNEY